MPSTDNAPLLCKYMTAETGKIVLQNRTLRWSTPGTLNDPYDTQFDLHVEIDREAVKVLALQKLWDAHYGAEPVPIGNMFGSLVQSLRGLFPRLTREEFDREFSEALDGSFVAIEQTMPGMQAEVRGLMADMKILCLTTAPDSTLMWTHYADAHRGIVLRFQSVPGLDSPWRLARPVQYLSNMPRLLDDSFIADMLSGRRTLDPMAIIDRLVYTKSAHWAYEQEWRLSSGAGRNPLALYEDIRFGKEELEAVIFDCRMPTEIRAEYVELVRRLYPDAKILHIEKDDRQFRLIAKPLAA